MFSSETTKKDFPIFTHHPDLVYLDSAATAFKPQSVIDAEKEYLEQYSTNIARGIYPLAETATEKFEMTREKVATFIGAQSSREIIFTAGTTDSLNLVSKLLASRINEGDNIVTTEMEHHSNFLPWKELAKRNTADFRVVSLTKEGTIDIDVLKKSIDAHTKIVAFSAISNVLGTINPVKEIAALIKGINPHIIIVVDAAQAVCHMKLSVSEWNIDFLAFSGHKMFGPTGVGILYGKLSLLETLYPVNFGGGMVLDACAKETMYKEAPYCFEAGTPNISSIIALSSAIDYIENIGLKNIHEHEHSLVLYTIEQLKENFGEAITIIGPTNPNERSGIVTFTFEGAHPHDVAAILGEHNICVRAGEHCTAPLHKSLKLHATTRISLSIYNDKNDIDKLISVLKEIQLMFG
ncbi:MAG: SufS family cysteine desulfurase [Candidatus Moraniibacteriota bacterium]